MDAKPDVSVVMGVYNGEDDIHYAVDSILSQKGVELEFIIVNDGSTDGTAEILNAYATSDGRVHVIHQENLGLTRALMRGCSEARGAFIARQDSDDMSLPGRLFLQVNMLRKHPDVAFVSSWVNWIGPKDELLFIRKVEDNDEIATKNLLFEKQGPGAHGSVMFRKSCYEACGGYRSEFYFAQDVDLWLRLGHEGLLAYVQKSLYQYRVSFSSISGSKGGLQTEYDRLAHACHQARLSGQNEDILLTEARTIRSEQLTQFQSISKKNPAYFIGRCLLANGDKRANAYLWMAVQIRPWHLKAWWSLLRGLLPTHSE